ncbi:MAG TPA: hypothetical protein VF175_13445, partial [Lacipirellula sp.]
MYVVPEECADNSPAFYTIAQVHAPPNAVPGFARGSRSMQDNVCSDETDPRPKAGAAICGKTLR